MVQVQGDLILGPPHRCRAFVAHSTHNIDRTMLREFAHQVIQIHTRWIFRTDVLARAEAVEQSALVMNDHGGFDGNFDYLVLNGDPLLSVAVALAIPTDQPLTLLRFDKQLNGYFPFRVRQG